MIEALDNLLRQQPVGLLFVVLGVGYLIGKTRVRGFELGPVTGVLFASLEASPRPTRSRTSSVSSA